MQTSDRHTGILNDYQCGAGPMYGWAREGLGRFSLDEWRWGEIRMGWTVGPDDVMPDGVMFGGRIAAVGDHVVGLAAMTVLTRDDQRFRTSRLETTYFRPVTQPAIAIAARVVNISRKLIHVEADFSNPEAKLCVRVTAVQVLRSVDPT